MGVGNLYILGHHHLWFPQLFFTYGPQSPTAFSNGPSCVEAQCDWIIQVLTEMRQKGLKRIDAAKNAEDQWRALVNRLSEKTLVHKIDNWYESLVLAFVY